MSSSTHHSRDSFLSHSCMGAEGKCSCLSLRAASYWASLFYLAVFLANLILLTYDRPWKEDQDEQWVRWQWVDIWVSSLSIIASMLLLIAIIKSKRRLLLVFITWAIMCIILSIVILGFNFQKYKREEVILRCIGIAITAYLVDAVLLFYYSLKTADTREIAKSSSKTLNMGPTTYLTDHGPHLTDYAQGETNGEFNNKQDDTRPGEYTRVDVACNYRLWYENSKM